MVCNRRSILCIGCRLLYDSEHRNYVFGCKWERFPEFCNYMGVSGIILSDKMDMYANMGNMGDASRRKDIPKYLVFMFTISDYLHSVFAVLKKDFQNRKMAWKLTDIFGGSAVVWSLLDGIFNKDFITEMPAGFRFTIYFFACAYLLILLLRGYERLRAERLENNKKQFLWEIERRKLLNQPVKNIQS